MSCRYLRPSSGREHRYECSLEHLILDHMISNFGRFRSKKTFVSFPPRIYGKTWFVGWGTLLCRAWPTHGLALEAAWFSSC